MQTQLIKIKDLRSNTGQVPGLPMNPRLIKDEKFAKLVKSIKDDPEMLHLREVIAYDNDGQLVVICGNMRLRALQELGIKEVPTKILPKETTVEKLKAYTIKDNVGFGEHDWELLANEWDPGQLADWGLDIDTPKEVDAEKELIEDIIPEDDEEIFVQEGDIYKLGNHTLMCGDSMSEETIKTLLKGKNKAVTHCISDPPYGISYNPDRHGMIKNDDVILDYTALGKKYSNGYFCMWTGWQVVEKWIALVRNTFGEMNNQIIWHKGGGGMGDCARTLAQDYELLLVVNRGNEIQGYRGSATWYWNSEEKEKFIKNASKEAMREVLTTLNEGQAIWKVGKDDVSEYLHPCLPAGEQIFIDGEWINIEDAQLGQKSEYGTIDTITTHDAEEIVEIEVDGQITKSTGNHPFLVERSNQILWIEARYIIIGDKILSKSNILDTLKPLCEKNDLQANILQETDTLQQSDITESTTTIKNDIDSHTTLNVKDTIDQSRNECKSTTTMKTSRIIELKTSSLGTPLNTSGFTLIADMYESDGKSFARYAEDTSSSTNPTGTTQEDGSQEKSAELVQSQKSEKREIFVSRMVGSVKTIQEKTKVWNLSIEGTPAFDTLIGVSHNTQKPVEINQRVLENFTGESSNVLDLFGGSGSNMIACEKTNRVCYMMELDPKYVQTIIKRFKAYTGGGAKIECINREVDFDIWE